MLQCHSVFKCTFPLHAAIYVGFYVVYSLIFNYSQQYSQLYLVLKHLKSNLYMRVSMSTHTDSHVDIGVPDNWKPLASHGFCSAGFVAVVIRWPFILPLMVWAFRLNSRSWVSCFCLCIVRIEARESWNFTPSPAQTSQGFTGHKQYKNV